MKRHLALLTLIMMFAAGAYSQANIFDPNDAIVQYNSSKPPATPAANTMAKWVKTTSRITNWSTSKFKAYYWNGMAFRLRFPNGYNAADTTKKYPVIIFMHGAGEIKGIYDNEDQLFWGAQPFQAKIDSGKFNSFLLFPQVSANGWDYSYYTRINSVLDSMQKYVQADPDKVIAMGLSNGAFGAMSYGFNFPQRISTIIASSPALIQLIQETIDNVIHIPLWVASGGLDTSPGPDVVNTYVDTLKARGGDTRYNFYPDLGHDTWERMWTEQWLLPYWNNAHTANPIIFNKNSQFCVNAVAAKMGITQGFAEYQWSLNGNVIPNATTNDIIGTQIGSYRARFRRVAGGPWSDWSTVPAVITALPPTPSPSISVAGIRSIVLPDAAGAVSTPLQMPTGYSYYEWRSLPDSLLLSNSRTYDAGIGTYIAKATNCNSTFSPVFKISSASGTPKPDSARNFSLTRVSATSTKLSWTDIATPISNETGFEIYRSRYANGGDTMIALTGADANTYTDSVQSNNYNYYYKIRAVNATGASGTTNKISLQPAVDSISPTTPAGIKAIFTARNYVDLEWNASSDNIGVVNYFVYVNGELKFFPTTTSVRVTGLQPNIAYTFAVDARDQAGNFSAISAATTATTKLNGLKYHYYEGTWSVLPDFSVLTPVASGATPNVDIATRPAGVDNNYGFVWEGLLNIKTPGTYTFETVSDDGSKFYYNTFYSPTATPLVNNDGVHGGISATGTVNIADTGLHPIAVTFFQQGSGQSMQLYWTGPGITRQLIPNAAFTESFAGVADTTAPSVPASVRSAFTSRNYIDLAWNASTDSVGVVAYDVYVNNVKKYTTTALAITADSLLPNVAYTFAVRARDFAGNTSAAGSFTVTTAATALKYKYYEGTWSVLPDFSALTPVKVGSTKNVDISVRPAGVVNNYGFVWEGYINIKTPGNYTFETTSDDGSKFYFDSFYSPDSAALVSNDGVHGAIIKTGTVNVTDTGMHPIAITYFQQNSGSSIQVYWTGPGIVRQLIPDSAFTQAYKLAADVSAPTTPTGLKTTFVANTSIDLSWTASTDNIGVVAYDIYVGGVKKYTSAINSVTADSLTANTTYAFTVRARDLAGNTSASSSTVSAKTATTSAGLKYSFFQGSWDVLPDFNTLTPVKTGTSSNVDISVRTTGVNDFFGFLWQGYINIPTAGNYTFETISDDGSKFYFNSAYLPTTTATVNNDGLHGATTVTATVNVPTAGYYPISLAYFDKDGGQSIQLYWTGPSITRATIPNSALVYQLPADNVAPTVPTNVTASLVNNTYMNLTWTGSTDNVGVVGYDVYLNGVKKYTTTTNSVTADSLTANTSYSFTVKALDFAGNASAFSTAYVKSTSASTNGLTYKYYEGVWDLLPNFSGLTPVKTGYAANIDIITARNQADNYGFVWEGNITLPAAGTYTFETISDDGSKVYFNQAYSAGATALVNNDGVHGAISATGSVTVGAAGVFPIAITYFEKNSGESMQLYWTGPGITRQVIPNSAFAGTFTLPKDSIAPTPPTNVTAVLNSNTFINLTWTASTDAVGVTSYDVYVNGTKKYNTVTNSITADSLNAGTSYVFTIKARDFAGNASAFSTALTTATTAAPSGLAYKYYQGTWDVLPNFTTLTPVKTGFMPNIDIITVRNQADNYGFVWEGNITLPTAGTYTFETVSDDGSKVYFNQAYTATATALVNNDGVHGPISATGSVTVAAGVYPIAITFFEKNSGESMQLYWSGPGITRQLVPNSAFAGTYVLPTDSVAPTTPTNVAAALTSNTFINLTWTASTDNVGVTAYDVYVNGTKKYTATTNSITADSLTAATSYVFTIKARDFAGNTSAFSTALTRTTTAAPSGLTYKYYQGTWDVLPNFNTLTPVKTGFTTNIDIITPRNQADNYGFVWEGNITLPTAGTYTFETISDDGSKVYFNQSYAPTATALVNNDGVHGAISATGSVTTAAGVYPIAITYFEKNSGESMQLYWTGPGIARQLVPNSAFAGTFVLPNDSTAPTAPANVKALLTTNTYVDIAWDASTDNIGVTGYDVYVNGVKKTTVTATNYRLTGLTAGQSNTFTIKALDLATNESAFSTALAVVSSPKANGFKYRYYQGSWNTLPNFDTLTAIKTGSSTTTDISVRTSGVNDNFGFVWEGYINITTPGTYTFETISDDGSRFYWNTLYNPAATALVNNDGLHGATSVTATVNVPTAGLYPISITYFEKDGGESMQVFYSGPGITRQLLPASAVSFSDEATATQGGTTSLASVAGSATEETVNAKLTSAYPNPFTENIKIQYAATNASKNVTVGVYDMNGRLVKRQLFGNTSAGTTTFSVSLDKQMMPGMYLIKLDVDGKSVKMWKMIKENK